MINTIPLDTQLDMKNNRLYNISSSPRPCVCAYVWMCSWRTRYSRSRRRSVFLPSSVSVKWWKKKLFFFILSRAHFYFFHPHHGPFSLFFLSFLLVSVYLAMRHEMNLQRVEWTRGRVTSTPSHRRIHLNEKEKQERREEKLCFTFLVASFCVAITYTHTNCDITWMDLVALKWIDLLKKKGGRKKEKKSWRERANEATDSLTFALSASLTLCLQLAGNCNTSTSNWITLPVIYYTFLHLSPSVFLISFYWICFFSFFSLE